MTLPLSESYPNYATWYQDTFLTGLKNGKNAYIIAKSENDIAGCCLVKKAEDERKICTLFVKPLYRRQGIGRALMDRAMSHLGDNVLISVSSKHLSNMTGLLCDFGFHLFKIKTGIYIPGETEYFCHTLPIQKITKQTIMTKSDERQRIR